MAERDVYLVGSVPMSSAEEVFSTVSATLGARVKRIPDGETGERLEWITWLEPVFAASPVMELSDEVFQVHGKATAYRRYRLKPGQSLDKFYIDNLFYADVAQQSYAVFKRLRDAGRIPPRTKLQVDFALGESVLWSFVADEIRLAVEPIYNEALGREIDKIAATIPHEDLAIQFDVASAVFARLQRNETGGHGETKKQMMIKFADIMAAMARHVPDKADLLLHFCYGDNNHRHSVEPENMADMVEMFGLLAARITRPINLVHMPVPRNRDDEAYFEPLRRLQRRPETELALGLVHYTDGVEGAARRMKTAAKFVRNFAIGTECGFGRRDPATIPELLRIHAEAAKLP